MVLGKSGGEVVGVYWGDGGRFTATHVPPHCFTLSVHVHFYDVCLSGVI